ncbi:DUF885 family protein, partial [Micromonospora zhanjiangensis]
LPAAAPATRALLEFARWLERGAANHGPRRPLGADGFGFLLHRVALLPYPLDDLRMIGERAAHRYRAAEVRHRRRYREHRPPPPFADVVGQIAAQRAAERSVYRFYRRHDLLPPMADLRRRYRNAAMPAELAPLAWLAVPHLLPHRPDEDAVRYLEPPARVGSFFAAAECLDPRVGVVHEGVHAYQAALSATRARPVRRHVIDSTPNEGIAYYNEQLLLDRGMFDDAPHSAGFLKRAMRLRALRVGVDIGLALGELTIPAAANRLADEASLDPDTARAEALFFAGNPGQALSYEVGKAQLLSLLDIASAADDFRLAAFHDWLVSDGNTPFALRAWERYGHRQWLNAADRLAGRHRDG